MLNCTYVKKWKSLPVLPRDLQFGTTQQVGILKLLKKCIVAINYNLIYYLPTIIIQFEHLTTEQYIIIHNIIVIVY